MSVPQIPNAVSDLLLVRKWLDTKIAEAGAIGLPMEHLSNEMLDRALTLITPRLAVESSRAVTYDLLMDVVVNLQTQVEAVIAADAAKSARPVAAVLPFAVRPAAKDEKVVPLRPGRGKQRC
jgi:hypothetical protein